MERMKDTFIDGNLYINKRLIIQGRTGDQILMGDGSVIEKSEVGGGGGDLKDYYTKTETNEQIKIETDRSTAKESELEGLIQKEADRSIAKENEINNKFNDYSLTADIPNIKVNNAIKADEATKAIQADEATKAIQDGDGNSITGTYATINNTYTKEEVDGKVVSVYKYKGSVENYASLPKENQVVGDVYNVEDTGSNYAWNGTEWDNLGGKVDLSNYYTKEGTDNQIRAEKEQTVAREAEIIAKFNDYSLTADIPNIKVNNAIKADEATKALSATNAVNANNSERDGDGNIIVDTYATKESINEINNKFNDYSLTTDIPNIKVNNAIDADNSLKATQDNKGNIIDSTYATIANTYNKNEIDNKTKFTLRYLGTVDKIANLPESKEIGDVYDVTEEYCKYVWTGTSWDPLGKDIDLTNYPTKEEVKNIKVNEALNSDNLGQRPAKDYILKENMPKIKNGNWTGTRAEFDTAKKIEDPLNENYIEDQTIINITDDSDTINISSGVSEGDFNPVSGDAVYKFIQSNIFDIFKKYSLEKEHPPKSFFWTEDETFDPNIEWGGTWVKIEGTFLYAASKDDVVDGSIKGSKTKTINYNNLPAHQHYVYLSGGSHQHDVPNIPDIHTTYPYNDTDAEGATVKRSYGNRTIPSSGSHSHSGTTQYGSTTSGSSRNNEPSNTPIDIMPPYMCAYCWKRIK